VVGAAPRRVKREAACAHRIHEPQSSANSSVCAALAIALLVLTSTATGVLYRVLFVYFNISCHTVKTHAHTRSKQSSISTQ